MRFRIRRTIRLCGLFVCGLAVAKTAFGSETAQIAELAPPRLLEYVEAVYPEDSLRDGVEATVLARIQVDTQGIVIAVQIVESAGEAFDAAATEAMLQFRFKPSTRNGVPVSAIVLYRYRFFLRNPQPTDDPQIEYEGSAQLSGLVTDMTDRPLPDSIVLLRSLEMEGDLFTTANDGPLEKRMQVDDNGRFEAPDLPPGEYRVDIIAPGYRSFVATENLADGEARTVRYRMVEEPGEFETVVRGRKPQREVTRRDISRREITRIPGTGGDALRSVQNLPGMARAPALSGQLIIRGSSPADSMYYFDQMPIPALYHFGGLTSVINSDLLDRIDFYPGNYSVRYGNAIGGVVDVYPRAPASDRFHGYVDVDLWDTSVLLETPLSQNWSVAASIRRSYIDAVLNAVLPENGGFAFRVAPRYWDYQLVLDYHGDATDTLRLFVFGSDDKVIFLFGNQVAGNPHFTGGIQLRTLFHQAQLRWNHRFRTGVSHEVNVGIGYRSMDSSIGDLFQFETQTIPFLIRNELSFTVSPRLLLRIGTDTRIHATQWSVISATAIPIEGEPMDPITGGTPFTTDGQGWFFWPAAYMDAEVRPVPTLRFIPGLRLGWFDPVRRFGLDPRLVVRYQAFPKTTFKGGIGLFHQAPNEAVSDPQFGNPDLALIRAVHYSAGVEQAITDHLEVGMEGFYKQLSRLVVSAEQADSQLLQFDGAGESLRYTSDGSGTVYGFELLARHRPTDLLFGWISYTFMQSTRIDRPGAPRRPFDFDQTHILTVVANLVLGKGWEAGLRFRLVTGNPITPVIGSVYDADGDTYWPMHGAVNADRLPAFHQLDFRVDKHWKFRRTRFSMYLDIQNIYNRKNVEGYQYNFDYTDRVYLYGLPLLPSLGLKLEY